MRVAIVGAGIGGLTLALALLRRGVEARVFEQAPALAEVGAGVQLSANATRVLFELGLGPALTACAFVPTEKRIRLWNTGQGWKAFDTGPLSVELYGSPYLTLHRCDLHAVLATAVRALSPDAITLAARCVDIAQDETGVDLSFEDGRQARADLLVGADGVHSVIRRCLFGPDQARVSGVLAWRGVIPAERLHPRLMTPQSTTWIGPGGHVVHYPLRRGELMNFVSVVERDDWRVESWSAPGSVQECLADYAGWHPDVHALISAIEQPYKCALLVREPMPRWTQGRATLLGDACHPMLPFLAQGAAMAIEDAQVLARALAAHGADFAMAFGAYESARLQRTARAVRGSAENMTRYHDARLTTPEDAEAYVEREWSEERVKERYAWLFGYDATRVDV